MIPEAVLKKIHNCQTPAELDQHLTSLLLIEDFSKPGLVILPVGNTYETGIYPAVNEKPV